LTCIVGVIDQDKGGVVMGGDSAGVGGWDLSMRKDPKVFINGSCIMGFTSSFRMGQLLRYKLKVPERKPGQELFEWMVSDFVDAVRASLKDGGYAVKDKDQESGGTFLVGVAGHLFTVHADYQVEEESANFAACGCGEQIAKGALHALGNAPTADTRVRVALEAAERFSAGVRAPFTILRQPLT